MMSGHDDTGQVIASNEVWDASIRCCVQAAPIAKGSASAQRRCGAEPPPADEGAKIHGQLC